MLLVLDRGAARRRGCILHFRFRRANTKSSPLPHSIDQPARLGGGVTRWKRPGPFRTGEQVRGWIAERNDWRNAAASLSIQRHALQATNERTPMECGPRTRELHPKGRVCTRPLRIEGGEMKHGRTGLTSHRLWGTPRDGSRRSDVASGCQPRIPAGRLSDAGLPSRRPNEGGPPPAAIARGPLTVPAGTACWRIVGVRQASRDWPMAMPGILEPPQL